MAVADQLRTECGTVVGLVGTIGAAHADQATFVWIELVDQEPPAVAEMSVYLLVIVGGDGDSNGAGHLALFVGLDGQHVLLAELMSPEDLDRLLELLEGETLG